MIELYGADVIECENCYTILTAPEQVHMEPIYDYYPIIASINLCKDCHNGCAIQTPLPPSPLSSIDEAAEMECDDKNEVQMGICSSSACVYSDPDKED